MGRGFVYFIEQDVTSAVKIGHTATLRGLRKRLDQLQTASPHPIRMICHTPGDRLVERALHKRFHEHRLSGEWFSPVAALMEFIENVKLIATTPIASDLEPFERAARQHRKRRPAGVIEKKGRWYYRPTTERARADRAKQGLPETVPLGMADTDEARRKWASVADLGN